MTDEIFDLRHVFVRNLDTGSGWNLHVHRKLAAIGTWKECPAQERIDGETRDKDPNQQGQCQNRKPQRAVDVAFIEIERQVKTAIEPDIETAAPGVIGVGDSSVTGGPALQK